MTEASHENGRVDLEESGTGENSASAPAPVAGTPPAAARTTPGRRSRYERIEGSPVPALTSQKVAILRYLSELRFLSLPQLARLTCPSEKSARRHLRELFDAALVEVVPVARAALASAGSMDGAQLLHGSAPRASASKLE